MKLVIESDNPEKDIEAIAKNRVMRVEGTRQTVWFLVMVAGLIVGFVVRNANMLASAGISLIGIGLFYYYNNGLTKRQKSYTQQLLGTWQQEKPEVKPSEAK